MARLGLMPDGAVPRLLALRAAGPRTERLREKIPHYRHYENLHLPKQAHWSALDFFAYRRDAVVIVQDQAAYKFVARSLF
jgi:hypothetical protein